MPAALVAGESCLALPKLNLQFLTAHDYLLRNFSLFRLEATYEIREDLSDVLARMGATWCALPADCPDFQVRCCARLVKGICLMFLGLAS